MRLFIRDDTTSRSRERWAKSIARLVDEIDRREPLMRSARPLYRKQVAIACLPSLNEIRWALEDSTATVSPQAMNRLRAFMTDGARSPLYHDDPESARRAARELASAFVVHRASQTAKTPAEDARPLAANASRA